jgi:hypothetical protein
MKQTAVDYLEECRQCDYITWEDIQQAKEMEKEQIINAHNLGYTDCKSYNIRSGEDYYNKTFNP